MITIDPHRVHSLVETHLDNLIADTRKELAVGTGEAAARFISGLKWEALVTIISAGATLRQTMRGTLARHQ